MQLTQAVFSHPEQESSESKSRFRLSVDELLIRFEGLIVVTGKVGSGKTSLLLALLNQLSLQQGQVSFQKDTKIS